MTLNFTIPGEPVGKARPRIGKGHTYTPEKTTNYEALVKSMYYNKYQGYKLQGPLKIIIHAVMCMPKSARKSNKKFESMCKGEILPVKKPDWDNIGKIITDALNKIAYDDDSQIVHATVIKTYGEIPRVTVELEEI